jgi:hypothetical protein
LLVTDRKQIEHGKVQVTSLADGKCTRSLREFWHVRTLRDCR